MIALNENWMRWTVASAARTIRAALLALDPDLQFQMITQDVAVGDNVSQTRTSIRKDVEFRYDGPWWTERSTHYDGRFFVSLLLQVAPGQTNLYTFPELVGKCAASLPTNLTVKKYGNAVGDDESSVTCLSRRDLVQVNNHGRRDNQGGVFAATIQTEFSGMFQ